MIRDEQRPRAARVTEDCFASVVRSYLASAKFAGYAEATKELWARYLMFAGRPDTLGNVSLQTLRPSLVQAYLDGLAGRPGTQSASLAAIKQLERWAIVRDILPRPITTGVETEEPEGGHTPWSDEHVAMVEKHARADIARVVTLGANTGQRGSDLVRMGWTDIELYEGMSGIKVIQKKTAREVWVPITAALAAAMSTWERRPGPFLTKLDGHPWTREQLTAAWVRQRDSTPELAPIKTAGLVIHGLRGHACVRLLRAGANSRQISDMVGMSEGMVKDYTRFSDQRANASAAVYHMQRTIQERPFDKLRRNG